MFEKLKQNGIYSNGILRHESKAGKISFYLWGFILLPKEDGIKWFYEGTEPIYTSFGIFQ